MGHLLGSPLSSSFSAKLRLMKEEEFFNAFNQFVSIIFNGSHFGTEIEKISLDNIFRAKLSHYIFKHILLEKNIILIFLHDAGYECKEQLLIWEEVLAGGELG